MKNYKSWRREVTTEDGYKCVDVEKVENGYIITITHMPKDEVAHDYGNTTKKYISSKKPEDLIKEMEPNLDKLSKSFMQLNNFMGGY